jgi:hypothetical protein
VKYCEPGLSILSSVEWHSIAFVRLSEYFCFQSESVPFCLCKLKPLSLCMSIQSSVFNPFVHSNFCFQSTVFSPFGQKLGTLENSFISVELVSY